MGRKVFSIFILILGVGLLSYPFVSNFLQQKNGSYVSDEYQQAAASLTKAQNDEMRAAAQAYNDRIGGSVFPDPFTDGKREVAAKDYQQLLNVKGLMAVVEIPKIAVKLPLYHGTSEAVLKKGLGHLEGSSLPIGGKNHHGVITGHTGLQHNKMFTHLSELVKGDEFYLQVLGETLAYQVDQIKVVEPGDSQDLLPEAEQDHLTLLTCTPYGVNSHRLLVRGIRVPYDPEKKEDTEKNTLLTDEQRLLIKVGGATAGVMLILIIIKWLRNR